MRNRLKITAILGGAPLVLLASALGFSQPSLDRALGHPIVDGESAAGIRLGDSEDAVVAAFGDASRTAEWRAGGDRKDLVYQLGDSSGDRDVTIRVTFTSADMGVEAIQLIIGRRTSVASPYLGPTAKGYQPGQPGEVARALYGAPDGTIVASPGSAALWWYRGAGIVFVPGETGDGDRREIRFIVLNPYLSPDDLVRLVADR